MVEPVCVEWILDMRKIIFKAPASVWDHRAGDPDTPVEDSAVLKAFDGYVYEDECFDEHIDRELEEAGISGGYLRFEYQKEDNLLFAITEYNLRRKLTETEVLKLREYTVGSGQMELVQILCKTEWTMTAYLSRWNVSIIGEINRWLLFVYAKSNHLQSVRERNRGVRLK